MGGCCIGDCCIANCGFCCILDFSSRCGDSHVETKSGGTSVSNDEFNAEVLRDLNDRCTREAAEETDKCTDYLMTHINQMITDLSELNKQKTKNGYSLNLDVDYLTKSILDTKKSLSNYISDKVKQRLVLEDYELSVILLERDDNRRNKAVNDFYSRIFNQAQSDLIAKIKESVRDQCDLVKEQLEGRKNEIAISLIKQQEQMIDIDQKYKEKSSKQPDLVECMFEISTANILSNQLAIASETAEKLKNRA
jgi:hypothetical protein